MALARFFRGYTIERLVHAASSVHSFITKCCPHLQNTIRKTKLKNGTGDCWIGALITKIDVLPRLYSAWFIIHDLERARIFGGEGHRSLRPHNLKEPGIGFSRSNALGVQRDRETVSTRGF